MTDYIHPIYSPAERRMRETFLTLMNAFAYPGRIYALPESGEPFALIAESLLDLETSAYTPLEWLQPVLAAAGARLLPAAGAAYHFYNTDALEGIVAAPIGTMNRPDDAATVFISGCTFDSGDQRTLSGAGINGTTTLRVGGVSDRLWELRAARVRFPLGWDVVLLDGHRVIGLPRTTNMVKG